MEIKTKTRPVPEGFNLVCGDVLTRFVPNNIHYPSGHWVACTWAYLRDQPGGKKGIGRCEYEAIINLTENMVKV